MTAPTALQILRSNRLEAINIASNVGWKRMKHVLETAQADLERRLRKAEGSKGPGAKSFTVADLRSTLAQVREVLKNSKPGMKGAIMTTGKEAAQEAAGGVVEYLQRGEQQFKGLNRKLPLREAFLFDRAVAGTESSLLHRLESDPVRGAGILDRYGDNVVQKFEETLQQRFVAQKDWADVRNELIASSPFLQQAPAYWAERIVRTEVMGAHGRSSWETLRNADAELGGGSVKILSATFDDRTGADSYAVHGQIRKPEEAFAWWGGNYQHPPNRPNDREVVVPHRIDWPIPDSLKWRSDGEVAARWAKDGRKGGPPGRPTMTTVPLDMFGKPTAAPAATQVQVPEQLEPQAPAAPPIEEPPAIPPRLARPAMASPFFEGELPSNIVQPAEILLHQKLSGAKGSNEGGLYATPSGVEHYVKFYNDPAQALIEHLTNNIYADLGVGAVESQVFEHQGKTAYASRVLEGSTLKDKGLNAKLAKQVMKGFVADVLTGNWDAVGTGLDNVLVKKDGTVVRVDTGGSLLMRAKAGRKPAHVLGQISEWEKLFDSGTNPYYSKVAKEAGVTSARDVAGVKDQIKAVLALRASEGGWAKYVERIAGAMNDADKRAIIDMLESRTGLLEQKLKELGKRQPKKFEMLAERNLEHQKLYQPLGVSEKAGALADWKSAQFSKLAEIRREVPQFQESLHAYTGASYGPIRDSAKLDKEEWNKKWGARGSYESARQQHDRIEQGFQRPTAGVEDQVQEVFRGINSVSREVVEKLIAAKTFEVEALSSTSWDPNIALGFGYDGGSANEYAVIFRYKLKPGTKNKLAIQELSTHENEKEVLLRKGAKFKKLGVSRMTTSGRKRTLLIELEEI